jgi:bifunctional UDP-N-acetylglucosamine pyrophosphorylase / glucosamine-1-phosphate N-acetyltransferase
MSETAAVVLAAGQGTRMKSDLPKVLHPLAGQPMLAHLWATLDALQPSPSRRVLVIGKGMEGVAKATPGAALAVQDPPLGTGHAARAAAPALDGFAGDVLVLFGDCPLVTTDTLQQMLAARRGPSDPAVVVLGFRPDDPAQYGRLVVGKGGLEAIVEFKDANPEQRAIGLCNGGAMAIDAKRLPVLLGELRNDNAQGEFYLTDVVAVARRHGWTCAVVEGDADEVLGINSRQQLAEAEAVVQERLRTAAMTAGASMRDPSTVYLSFDTRLGRDVTIEPNVVFGPGVTVGDKVTIRGFSHIEGATVATGAIVGPFARLRPGAVIGDDAHIGNFVEIKAATVETGAKVNHLAYIGDARVGAKSNIGAGTITCNYDGFTKTKTDIGAGVFVGSNSTLVAPLTIGDGAYIAAGSTITKGVPADSLSIGRARQEDKPGRASVIRQMRQKKKP